MQSSIVINTVSCHAEGEVGDVITGGVYNPPGNTILEKSQYISKSSSYSYSSPIPKILLL